MEAPSDPNLVRDTIPRAQHIAYFQAVLVGVANSSTYDELRMSIRQAAKDSGGRVTASRTADNSSYWSPVTNALSELMRLELVERRPLPSSVKTIDAHRSTTYQLTNAGKALSDRVGDNDAVFRQEITPILLKQHAYFAGLCRMLAEAPLLIPGYTEEELKHFRALGASWTDQLGADAADRMRRAMPTAILTSETVIERVRNVLERRFSPEAQPSTKAVLDAVDDALIVAALNSRSLQFDATSFNLLTSWGAQLYLLNESRYVRGLDGRVIWSCADISFGTEITVQRRGLTTMGDRIVDALAKAYRAIADDPLNETGATGSRYPYLDIYRVRALAAYSVGVSDQLVDRVIADLVDGTRVTAFQVEVAVGTGVWQASSETLFYIGAKRFNVILIKPKEEAS
jgi:hypothetical protein